MMPAHTTPVTRVERRGRKSLWTTIALLLLIVSAGSLNFCIEPRRVAAPGTQQVEIAGRTFHLELALDDAARYQGLSHRREIADDGGMLFVFPRARELDFVMRDCLVPIDIAFLDGEGRVVSTHAMRVEPPESRARPRTYYNSGEPAQFAIELRGGKLRELDVRRGQRIALPLAELKRLAR